MLSRVERDWLERHNFWHLSVQLCCKFLLNLTWKSKRALTSTTAKTALSYEKKTENYPSPWLEFKELNRISTALIWTFKILFCNFIFCGIIIWTAIDNSKKKQGKKKIQSGKNIKFFGYLENHGRIYRYYFRKYNFYRNFFMKNPTRKIKLNQQKI